jgi:hypothetical protein
MLGLSKALSSLEIRLDGVSDWQLVTKTFLPARIIHRSWRSADTRFRAFGASPFRPRGAARLLMKRDE